MSIDYTNVDLTWQRFRAADEAIRQGHMTKASRIIREALSETEQLGVVDARIVNSADAIAERCLLEGDYTAAAAMYRAILDAKSKVLGNDHPQVREARSKLAAALWQNGGLTPKLLSANQ